MCIHIAYYLFTLLILYYCTILVKYRYTLPANTQLNYIAWQIFSWPVSPVGICSTAVHIKRHLMPAFVFKLMYIHLKICLIFIKKNYLFVEIKSELNVCAQKWFRDQSEWISDFNLCLMMILFKWKISIPVKLLLRKSI